MSNICDHTSVGMLIWKDDKLLLIERAKLPKGFAPPAGHVDELGTYEQAAITEIHEEVGFEAIKLELINEGRRENLCRREDGNWHYWKIFKVEVKGELKRNEDETKQAGWYSIEEIKQLAARTEEYQKGIISEEDWNQTPGLEPVWYEWFKELKVI